MRESRAMPMTKPSAVAAAAETTRDQHGVDDADPEQREIVRLRRVIGEDERDLDAGGAEQEVEAGRDAGVAHVARGVDDEEGEQAEHADQHEGLPEQVADFFW